MNATPFWAFLPHREKMPEWASSIIPWDGTLPAPDPLYKLGAFYFDQLRNPQTIGSMLKGNGSNNSNGNNNTVRSIFFRTTKQFYTMLILFFSLSSSCLNIALVVIAYSKDLFFFPLSCVRQPERLRRHTHRRNYGTHQIRPRARGLYIHPLRAKTLPLFRGIIRYGGSTHGTYVWEGGPLGDSCMGAETQEEKARCPLLRVVPVWPLSR